MVESPLPFIVEMAKKMYEKWLKYWNSGNLLPAIAYVLDPRFKMSAAEFYFRHMDLHGCEGFLQNIKQCLGMLFDEYTFLEMEAQDGETSQS